MTISLRDAVVSVTQNGYRSNGIDHAIEHRHNDRPVGETVEFTDCYVSCDHPGVMLPEVRISGHICWSRRPFAPNDDKVIMDVHVFLNDGKHERAIYHVNRFPSAEDQAA